MILFVLVLVLAFAFWVYWDNENTDASVDNLAKAGFQADETLEGRPRVQFDTGQHKVAFVSATQATVYDYGQVLGWEFGSSSRPGYNDRSDTPEDHYVVFYLQYQDEPTVRVDALDNDEVAYWQGRLEQLLGKQGGAKP